MNTGRPRDCDDEAVLIAARAMIFCGRYPSARAICPILGRRWSVRTCHSSLQRLRAAGKLLEPVGAARDPRPQDGEQVMARLRVAMRASEALRQYVSECTPNPEEA